MKAEQHGAEGAVVMLLFTKSKHEAKSLNCVLQSVWALAAAVHITNMTTRAAKAFLVPLTAAMFAAAELKELTRNALP